MILYFSGTGNTEYLAKNLSQILEDEVVDLFSYIKNNKNKDFHSEKPLILLSPIYGWRLPRFLSRYLKKCKFSFNRDIYVIVNYGDSAGNADKYIREDIKTLGLNYKGLYGIKMPENYLMLFNLDSDETNRNVVKSAKDEILKAGNIILENKNFNKPKIGLIDRFLSSVVNSVFYKFIVKDSKFYYTDKCISCGACKDFCVLNNITYENGFPKWNGRCTHCTSCISKCPTCAIEYGKKTVGKNRYLFKNL